MDHSPLLVVVILGMCLLVESHRRPNCDNPPIVTGAANIVKGHYVAYKCDDPYTYNGGDHLWSCGSRQWRNTGVPLTCSVDGGWSPWGEWDACTATCGNSTHTRTRTCDNPAPLNDGDTCPGSQTDTDDCRFFLCPAPLVATNAHLTQDLTPGNNERIIYDDVTMNHGNAYSTIDGTFTAPLDGTYSFSISACSSKNHFIILDLMHNNTAVKSLLAGDKGNRECTSITTMLDLQTGDEVWVQHQESRGDFIETTFVPQAVSFTGLLLHAS